MTGQKERLCLILELVPTEMIVWTLTVAGISVLDKDPK